METNIEALLSETFLKVANLEGVYAEHSEDELYIEGGYYNNFLAMFYLSELFKKGKATITIDDDKMSYLLKLINRKENN